MTIDAVVGAGLGAGLGNDEREERAHEAGRGYAEKTIHSAPRVAMMSQIPMVFLSGTPAGAGGRWG